MMAAVVIMITTFLLGFLGRIFNENEGKSHKNDRQTIDKKGNILAIELKIKFAGLQRL